VIRHVSQAPSRIVSYLGAVGGVGLATLITVVIYPWTGSSVSLLFFPTVMIPAMYGGYGPALLATVLSTFSLAYFLVPPVYSLDIGLDDFIRLAVFVAVALITASVSSARRRAEQALRDSLHDLRAINTALRKIGDWPRLVGVDALEGTREMLEHAAEIVGATEALAVWENDEEPWVYLASPSSIDVVTRHRPGDLSAVISKALACGVPSPGGPDSRDADNPVLSLEFTGKGVASVPFSTEHLNGRVFFTGLIDVTANVAPAVELVAREVGSSLDQLYLTEQMRGLAAQDERIRLARDLHDGVLQSLTGIRLQLQGMAEEHLERGATKERLLAIERAIAIEQRELRLFIDDVRPEKQPRADAGDLAAGLEEMRRRLGIEWKTPISIRVTPPTISLSQATYRTLRLMIHEAVINALKHAHPSRVSVDVQAGDARKLKILVVDDGRGFPFTGRLDHEALVKSGSGPLSLRDRVIALGGTMAVESGPSGACVEILLSLET
jgi:signal transduction histidine kinase